MIHRAGAAVASATIFGALVACIDAPVFVPVDDDVDAGATTTHVADGTAGSDAEKDSVDRPPRDEGGACDDRCGDAGGTCEGEICVVRCSEASPCRGATKCPPGLACSIACEGKQACDKVDCVSSRSCSVTCAGERACSGDVRVDAPSGEIRCEGHQACNGKVECKGATCAIACAAASCKAGEVRCCASHCTVDGLAASCKPD